MIILDNIDRYKLIPNTKPKEFNSEYFHSKTFEEQKKIFENNFNFLKYKFPREEVQKIKLFKNQFLISRITSKNISNFNKFEIINFFNNPMNFHWSETTWSLRESEYILRFYNEKDKLIGETWICLEGCGMIESVPFSPNMKFGGLSEIGKKKINLILEKIL